MCDEVAPRPDTDLFVVGLAPWLLWLPLSQGEEPPPPAASPSRSAVDDRLAEAERLNDEVAALRAGSVSRGHGEGPSGRRDLQGGAGRATLATAESLNNLAFLLQAEGDYAAARPLYEQALAIRKQVQGTHTPTPPEA